MKRISIGHGSLQEPPPRLKQGSAEPSARARRPPTQLQPRPPPPPQPQPPPAPPQPQVYNISRHDFRSIVQQLTGTPRGDPPPPPRSRARHEVAEDPAASAHSDRSAAPPRFQNPSPNPSLNPGFFSRPNPVAQSPVSAYMKYLESSLLYSDGRPPVPSPGLLPPPPPLQLPPFPSPRANPNPNHNPNPSPHPGLLPSPVPPSPSSFMNLLSPKSPYPLLSPGFQYPPPLTPTNFSFPPLSPGILGPGPGSHLAPPPSPGLLFPPSPSGFFPISSPRWRDM
ncbi:LOW QUALITY PROTEIN: protein HAIKU1-like [Asparagus officinalis]|uniref:LOW QUALITY PROTEIN: protein HAIKU1-like n=1 Tax=Asparagus officinalis TaxID=4686 RepID=UPI00098DF7F8|nr:LOW QUALITY PROTEIN: protein HAIKU1-like [Asparagus officinalis]